MDKEILIVFISWITLNIDDRTLFGVDLARYYGFFAYVYANRCILHQCENLMSRLFAKIHHLNFAAGSIDKLKQRACETNENFDPLPSIARNIRHRVLKLIKRLQSAIGLSPHDGSFFYAGYDTPLRKIRFRNVPTPGYYQITVSGLSGYLQTLKKIGRIMVVGNNLRDIGISLESDHDICVSGYDYEYVIKEYNKHKFFIQFDQQQRITTFQYTKMLCALDTRKRRTYAAVAKSILTNIRYHNEDSFSYSLHKHGIPNHTCNIDNRMSVVTFTAI